ncbi:pyridoxamine 5'-phosphate oxidase family protein [Streptomyces gobiensis]|uniref:pyridoxamine 5'-phosphate oxidase family protein n=1 Tax=Streptomyces gobiensis TaxID=2875706 RepID=UPI001E453221|nr:pyridoxamine 5'-phosphate oxidase family protein [Streptomyces gobiensis]UGY92656.1 pyridoxamine 5'-phosphate oxidase family protein [Streptomyces gobiensis]
MPTEEEEARAIELLARTPYGRVGASRQALPFVTIARHVVLDGAVLIRLHRGFGYHRACDGSVVAYEADNVGHGGDDVWSVQFVGTARLITPNAAQLARFGPLSSTADGAPFDPAYLRIDPQFIQLHHLTNVPHHT